MDQENFGALAWLAEQGAHFALPFGRTKNKFEADWPNKPHGLQDAMNHAERGGNVGILTGRHSANIVALDRDIDFNETVAMLGDLGKTAKIVRSNAPGRGKLLYRIVGDIPPTTSYKPDGAKHPVLELLGDNGQRHALCPPSMIDEGYYQLLDIELGIQSITPTELDYIWRLITGGSVYREVRDQEAAQAERVAGNDYVTQVKDAWTVQTVFEHFGRAGKGLQKERGETRLLGNGGLLISKDGSTWYDHADSVGGDKLDAWAWCKWSKRIDRANPKMFWDVINDMADAVGIAQPEKNRVHLNGSGPQPEPAPNPAAPLDAMHYRAEDGGILDAWLTHYSPDWLFVVGPDKWHYWHGTHWMRDEKLIISDQVEKLMDTMNKQCSTYLREAPEKIKSISEKYAKVGLDIPEAAIKEIESIKARNEAAKAMHKATKRSSARIASVEIMARFKRGQAVSEMDASDAINLRNGTLNLHSLELLPHSRDDFFTYCLDYEYDPKADCPQFKKFIAEVLIREGTTETDQALVNLFQELLGYSLTPEIKHEVMIWMFGEGGNGKSVAISVIEGLLGPMSMSIDFQTVGTPGNYDLADIPGKRVLFSTEAERNKFMAEGYIKRIVTGDTINTRPIYGSTIRFKSAAKIWWSMNDKPLIRDTTDSMWRRMKLIPFLRKFEEGKNADPDLTNKLLAELSGILNWAIDGLIRLKLNGKFTQAEAAEEAKRQYREEANPVAQWVNTQTVKTKHPTTLAGALFRNYLDWCLAQNEKPVTATQFGKDLKRLKIDAEHKMTGKMYFLALVEPYRRENE